MIKQLAWLLRRLAGRSQKPAEVHEETPEQRIDAARDRLKETIPAPEDEP